MKSRFLFCVLGVALLIPLAKSLAKVRSLKAGQCLLQNGDFGAEGTQTIHLKKLVSGLQVPWAIAFIPGTMDYLVTERPGRIRLVKDKTNLQKESVAEIQVGESGEGGLLGLAVHPKFSSNHLFYVYYTVAKSAGNVNRVARYRLSEDEKKASLDQIIIDDIPSGTFHNGGRIKFGPDGMLYIGTGDARAPENAQNLGTPAGKILRLGPDGEIPSDNPWPGKPAYVMGVRNVEAFDWDASGNLFISDHGPSGELGRSGHDEMDLAHAGDNLGWPTIYSCEEKPGMIAPLLTWENAAPPGGASFYRGTSFPAWKGNYLIATLGSRHMHRVVLSESGTGHTVQIAKHEVYFQGDPPQGFGRLRELITGPDNEIYITTSNCDSRGNCPTDGDGIYQLVP